jgi:recombinational DNA repair protein RecT
MSTALTQITQVREEIIPLKAEFGTMLPSHIPADKFIEVIITAVERDPALLLADRPSLLIAAKEAASDGLLPDKKEGAFVVYNTKVKVPGEQNPRTPNVKPLDKEIWVKLVRWMPMIFGVRKKMFQTGKVKDIQVELVHEHDVYRRAAGDDAAIVHEPLDFGDRGAIKGGYAIIKTTDGGVFREVMSLAQIEAVAGVSKTDTVWKGPFRTEMMRKTIVRRLAKQVPLSAEVERVLARDDSMYDLGRERLISAAGMAALTDPRHSAARSLSAKEMLEDEAIRATPAEEENAESTLPAEEPEAEVVATESNPRVVELVTELRNAEDARDLANAVDDVDALVVEGEVSAEEVNWFGEVITARMNDLGIPRVEGLTFVASIDAWIAENDPDDDDEGDAGQPEETQAAAGEPVEREKEHLPDSEPLGGGDDAPAAPEGEAGEAPAPVEAEAEIHFPLRGITSSVVGIREWDDPDLWVSDMLTKLDSVRGEPAKAFWTANQGFVEFARDHGNPEHAGKILAVAIQRGLYVAVAS